MRAKLLLVTSALLYALPFWYTQHFWFLIFLFPVPLLFYTLHKKATFWHGYLWALLSFSFHSAGIVFGIIHMASIENNSFIKLLPPLLIIFYTPLYAGILFFCAQKIIDAFSVKNILLKSIAWLFVLWAYFYIIDTAFLCIGGIKEGCMLMHPLLILAHKPKLLWLLPWLGKKFLSFLFFLPAMFLTIWLINKKKIYLLLFFTSLLPWLISWCTPQPIIQTPKWLNRIVSLPITFHANKNLESMILAAQYEFKKIVHHHSDKDIIIIPESSFYDCKIPEHNHVLSQWSKNYLGKPIHIFLGTFNKQHHQYHNALIWIFNGQLIECFNKRHAMLLSERLPDWLDVNWIRNRYFKNTSPIQAATNIRPLLKLSDNIAFVPYICSELFFNQRTDDHYPTYPILAVCNDHWAPLKHTKYQLYLAAQFKTVEWQRPIIYISYQHATYFMTNGSTHQITQL